MSEELRFFLRTAVYTTVIGVVYWFVSYESAGTVMLVAVVLASLVLVAVLLLTLRATRDEIVPGEGTGMRRIAGAVIRTFGFTDNPGDEAHAPLAAGLDPIPTRSSWPLLAAVAAALLGLGLIYGPWLLIPGLVLLAMTVWGWVTQLR